MNKRRYAWLILSLTCVSVVSVLTMRPKEASYRGKSVSEWLNVAKWTNRNKEACEAFQQMGPKAVPALMRMARNYDSPSQRAYRKVWPLIPTWGQKRLRVPRLPSDEQFYSNVGFAISLTGSQNIPALTKALKDSNDGVRRAGGAALVFLKAESAPAVHGLVQALEDKQGIVRVYATIALGQIGITNRVAIPGLIKALLDNEQSKTGTGMVAVRVNAAKVLGNMGSDAKLAVPALQKLMLAPPWSSFTDLEEATKIQAALALWKIASDLNPLLPFLIELLETTTYASTQFMILDVLAEIGPPAKAAIPTIRKVEQGQRIKPNADSRSSEMPDKARKALERIDPESTATEKD
jgi:HEAT repeat protein